MIFNPKTKFLPQNFLTSFRLLGNFQEIISNPYILFKLACEIKFSHQFWIFPWNCLFPLIYPSILKNSLDSWVSTNAHFLIFQYFGQHFAKKNLKYLSKIAKLSLKLEKFIKTSKILPESCNFSWIFCRYFLKPPPAFGGGSAPDPLLGYPL